MVLPRPKSSPHFAETGKVEVHKTNQLLKCSWTISRVAGFYGALEEAGMSWRFRSPARSGGVCVSKQYLADWDGTGTSDTFAEPSGRVDLFLVADSSEYIC
ncbi:MAG: hypothetical protein ACJAZ1_000930 [Yoonia sp.]|jgi:hypothetical protein